VQEISRISDALEHYQAVCETRVLKPLHDLDASLAQATEGDAQMLQWARDERARISTAAIPPTKGATAKVAP